MLLTEIVSSVLQLFVFTLIPLIVYLIRKKTFKGFFHYTGLHGTTAIAIYWSMVVAVLFLIAGIGLSFISEEIGDMMHDPNSVTGKFKALGFSTTTLIMVLLIAWIKTSLAEEIFFRGFVAKGLMDWLGYSTGNILQSLIFGLVHIGLFWAITQSGSLALAFIFVFSTAAGYMIGWVKVKMGEGSIVPGWIAHGLGNTISYSVIGFLM